MEGVASEAASLAGHLRLGKLIYLYDDNHISIEGPTDIAFTEDRGGRFAAYGWHVQRVEDGLDVAAMDRAIQAAKQDPRPSLIMVRTTIGSAQSVALAIDRARWPEVVGTLSGDDTIFIATASERAQRAVLDHLRSLASR